MKYFTIKELCQSETSERFGIKNNPNDEQLENLVELIDYLDMIREQWGSAILITSGFRCIKLNEILNGAINSSHLEGNAVDMIPVNGKFDEFVGFLKRYVASNSYIPFDQLIIERNSKGSRWIHFAINGKVRKQIFNLNVV